MSDKDIEKVDVTDEEDVEEEETEEVEDDDSEDADDVDEEDSDDEDDSDDEEEDEDEEPDELAKAHEEIASLKKRLAKKAKRQQLAKKAKGNKKVTSSDGSTPSVDDMFVVTANQLDQSEFEQAQKIAELEDTDLAGAVKSRLFKTWRKGYKEDLKKDRAALGTSKGSGKAKKKKTFANVTKREDHKKLWQKRVGQS